MCCGVDDGRFSLQNFGTLAVGLLTLSLFLECSRR